MYRSTSQNIMKQYFYIIGYHFGDDDLKIEKVFLQEDQAITFGRKFATKNNRTRVSMFRQLIATTATVEFVEVLKPFKTEER